MCNNKLYYVKKIEHFIPQRQIVINIFYSNSKLSRIKENSQMVNNL